jgi:F-type H+-transporting ATPase subunit b
MHFDWSTLALQTVNVLVLIWLLRRFLFRPVAEMIAARRAAAEKTLADAAALRKQAEERLAGISQREAQMQAEADRIRKAAREAAQAERKAILQQASDEASKLRTQAEADIRRERVEMERMLEVQAGELAVTIASRLLQRVPADQEDQLKLAWLDRALLQAAKDAPAESAFQGSEIEVVSATPFTPDQRETAIAHVARALGGARDVRFSVEPALIAGVELHAAHCVIRDNWQSDLRAIDAELHRSETNVEPALA